MVVLRDYVYAVLNRQDEYKEAVDYYEGEIGEVFSTYQLRRALKASGHKGQHNYCKVVVDAVLNRLEIANVYATNNQAQNKITEVWGDNALDLEANEVHRKALVYGDCFALVWPDEEGKWLISYNSPRTTAVVYDPENPRKKLYAVKMWKVGNPLAGNPASDYAVVGNDSVGDPSVARVQTRLNIYTADAVVKYVADGDGITEGTNWSFIGREDNPFGEIPVFHFRTHRPWGRPEHFSAYGPQNDINKLLATHFYTVDYQGAPQRYALAYTGDADLVDFGDDAVDRENMARLHSDPGSLWYLKGIMNVGEFKPADPDVFWKPISNLKQAMAALTDTPFHYLERPINVSGGEALRVSEAPLMKKVKDRQLSFGQTWKELFTFILKAEGVKAQLEIKWATVESMDSLDEWDVMLKKINAGLSHRQALREAGYEEKDIDRIMQERQDEASQSQFYNRTDVNGQQSLQNIPAARVSTADNAPNNQNRNGLTEDAKVNGGRGTNNNNGGK